MIILFLFIATKGRRYDELCFSNAVTFSDISDGLGEYNVITIKAWIENKIVLINQALICTPRQSK